MNDIIDNMGETIIGLEDTLNESNLKILCRLRLNNCYDKIYNEIYNLIKEYEGNISYDVLNHFIYKIFELYSNEIGIYNSNTIKKDHKIACLNNLRIVINQYYNEIKNSSMISMIDIIYEYYINFSKYNN